MQSLLATALLLLLTYNNVVDAADNNVGAALPCNNRSPPLDVAILLDTDCITSHSPPSGKSYRAHQATMLSMVFGLLHSDYKKCKFAQNQIAVAVYHEHNFTILSHLNENLDEEQVKELINDRKHWEYFNVDSNKTMCYLHKTVAEILNSTGKQIFNKSNGHRPTAHKMIILSPDIKELYGQTLLGKDLVKDAGLANNASIFLYNPTPDVCADNKCAIFFQSQTCNPESVTGDLCCRGCDEGKGTENERCKCGEPIKEYKVQLEKHGVKLGDFSDDKSFKNLYNKLVLGESDLKSAATTALKVPAWLVWSLVAAAVLQTITKNLDGAFQ